MASQRRCSVRRLMRVALLTPHSKPEVGKNSGAKQQHIVKRPESVNRTKEQANLLAQANLEVAFEANTAAGRPSWEGSGSTQDMVVPPAKCLVGCARRQPLRGYPCTKALVKRCCMKAAQLARETIYVNS